MKDNVLKIYLISFLIYLLPLISLFLFVLTSKLGSTIYMHFWCFFIIGWLPCGIIGLPFSVVGLIKSIKNNDNFNKTFGRFVILCGLVSLFLGILGLGVIYVVTS